MSVATQIQLYWRIAAQHVPERQRGRFVNAMIRCDHASRWWRSVQ